MAAATIDYAELVKGLPAGAWVVISERANHVIAFGAELAPLMAQAHEAGEDEPLVLRLPDQLATLFL